MSSSVEALEEKLKGNSLPPEAAEVAAARIKALRASEPDSLEQVDTKFYLSELLRMPWEKPSGVKFQPDRVPELLNLRFFGPTTIPEVLANFLTEIYSAEDPIPANWPTPVFFGPSGIGKRTLGRRIGEAVGRPVQVINLNLLESDADLFGVYTDRVRGRPGKIVEALQSSGRADPVVILAGLDWPVRTWQDRGVSVIRFLFDPEARRNFRDRFLDVDLDLSRALFVGTAASYDILPSESYRNLLPIDWAGYTRGRKLEIATESLIPSLLARHALKAEDFQILDAALETLVNDYTNESGVEDLERLLDYLCHRVAVVLATGGAALRPIDPGLVQELLGAPRKYGRDADAPPRTGVALGIVDSPDGAWVEQVEVAQIPGAEGYSLTGVASDSLSRVVDCSYHYLRSRMTEMDITARQLYEYGYRVHMRSNGRLEDPAIGLAVTAAFISQIRDRFVDPELALVGEITLNGRVLGAPGLHHKLLAAHRRGIHRLIVPRENRSDLDELPDDLKNEMSIVEVEEADHAIRVALQ